jgi:formylglycine-generating enzyme required for sulfatase activity
LFISHSSKQSIQALAFQSWLEGNGWDRDDVFIDLHGIGAGDRWRETLVKANVACEALLYLASPDSVASDECKREIRRAQDDRKEIIVALLHHLKVDDPRLASYADRQMVDLSADPYDVHVEVEHQGEKHVIDFNRQALNSIHAKLIELGLAPDSFVWPPKDKPEAAPYPGLDALDEHSASIFFGREAEVMGGIRELRQIQHRGSPRMLIIQAASGAGKSSFLRAGLWPKLGRTAEFLPVCIARPAKGILTGQYGIGHGLSSWFALHNQPIAPGLIHAELTKGDEVAGAAALAQYLMKAVAHVAEERTLAATDKTDDKTPVLLSPLIAIDQGEELFAAEDAVESNRFLKMLAKLLSPRHDGLAPYVLVTIRADGVDNLLRRIPELGIDTPQVIALPPLSPAAYDDVITKPAAVYTRRVRRLDIEPELVRALVNDATGADALPLLAFTLQRLFNDYSLEQKLTCQHYTAIGGIGGSIDRTLAQAQRQAGSGGTEECLRRLILPGLATWDPTACAAKRLVAREADLTGRDRACLAPLAEALVGARLLTRNRDTLEVSHEALLRRQPVAGWLDQQKDALKLRDDVLKEAAEWAQGGNKAGDLVRRGERLEHANKLLGDPDFKTALLPASSYLSACCKMELQANTRARRGQMLVMILMAGSILILLGAYFWPQIVGLWHKYRVERPYIAANIKPYVLTSAAERALRPGDTFHECRKGCPEMVVVPAGEFWMGSPEGQGSKLGNEYPRHRVTIVKHIAVSKFEIAAEDWQVYVSYGDGWYDRCRSRSGGKGREPASGISWYDAVRYAQWLSRVTTGRPETYRLLTEAEWEYAARAGSKDFHVYSWGDEIGVGNACCDGCGSRWDERNAAPVGSFKRNEFGLYDMHGNVWEWVEDCFAESYEITPRDGSAATGPPTCERVLRGGSWFSKEDNLRSAKRYHNAPDFRYNLAGIRLAREIAFERPTGDRK